MRSSTKRKIQLAIPAIAAAGFASLITGSAHGSFLVSFTNGLLPAATVGGDDIYVLQEQNLNTVGTQVTGTGMAAVDVTIDTPGSFSSTTGAMIIQSNADIDGDGLNDYNVLGAVDQNGVATQPSFGTAVSTFIGYNTTSTTIKHVTAGLAPLANSDLLAVYVNSQTYTHNTGLVSGSAQSLSGNPAVFETNEDGSGNPNTLDPAFIAGTIHSLEITYDTAINSDSANHDIANIVVPHGTPVSAVVQIGSTLSGTNSEVYTVMAGVTVTTSPSLTLSLTSTPQFPVAATVSVSGSQAQGYTPAFTTIPTAEAVTGSLVVNGFLPGDQEIYALDVLANGTQASGAALAAIIAELQAVASPAGTLVQAITDPRIQGLFPNANVEVVGTDPMDLNYDLSEDLVNNPSIASIGVVPEPTGVGLLIVGGLGLLARRRRSMQA